VGLRSCLGNGVAIPESTWVNLDWHAIIASAKITLGLRSVAATQHGSETLAA
jgi:hypothetical protein